MNEKTVNLGCVIAYMLWAIAFALIAAGWVVGMDLDSDVTGIALMSFGLAFSAGAATATIRRYFVVQNRLLKDAFDLGREARHAAGVRRITH